MAHALCLGEFKQADEHGGDPLAMGNAVTLDHLKGAGGVEFLHDTGGAAHADGDHRMPQGGRVIQRRGAEIARVRTIAEKRRQQFQ